MMFGRISGEGKMVKAGNNKGFSLFPSRYSLFTPYSLPCILGILFSVRKDQAECQRDDDAGSHSYKSVEQEGEGGIVSHHQQHQQAGDHSCERCFRAYPREEDTEDKDGPQSACQQSEEGVELIPQ